MPEGNAAGDVRLDGVPFGQQRLLYHRAENATDRAGVGVVGAELAAFGRVEAAFKQGAENGRVDLAPVEPGGGQHGVDAGGRQREDIDLGKQATVEPENVVFAKRPALLHRRKQAAEARHEGFRAFAGAFQQAGKQSVGQQAHVFGKAGKQALVEKMRNSVRLVAGGAQGIGQLGKVARGIFGDGGDSAAGLELLRLEKQRLELGQIGRGGQLVDGDGVHIADGVGEIGVYLDGLNVAHHQQRRVVQRQCVTLHLLQGLAQIAAGAFVFDGEMATLEHIGPAVATAGFAGAFFKTEVTAVLVDIGRLGVVEQFTQVEKMLLVQGALGAGLAGPFGDELCWSHGVQCLRCRSGGHCTLAARWCGGWATKQQGPCRCRQGPCLAEGGSVGALGADVAGYDGH